MALNSIFSGKIKQPHRIVVYGLDGVGKTTFAAGAPSPIFIGAEMGTAQLDVARFPQPQSWGDVLDAIRELAQNDHPYKTLVIDTLDWLEPLAHRAICAEAGCKSIDDKKKLSFGAGYNQTVEYFRSLFAYLERLQERKGMNVILLAHAHIQKLQNPGDEDYDRWVLTLHKKVSPVVRQWPNEVLFADYLTETHEQNGRTKGISNGARVLHTERTAAYDAKNRHDLPVEIPLDWDAFEGFINKSNDNGDKS